MNFFFFSSSEKQVLKVVFLIIVLKSIIPIRELHKLFISYRTLVFFRKGIVFHSVVLVVIEMLHEVQWGIAEANAVHRDVMWET